MSKIQSIIVRDSKESMWEVGLDFRGYVIRDMVDCWENGEEVTMYSDDSKLIARFPMSSIIQINYV